MIVNVSEVEPQPGSTVWTGHGIEEETGDEITFAGDWRAMEGLMLLVEDVGEVPAEVEGWQVLSRVRADTPSSSSSE